MNDRTAKQPPLINKIIEKIPQTIRLRSGLYLHTRHRRDTGEFWHIFTSAEYLSLVPYLARVPLSSGTIVDCGASIGLFTLLVEQLCRVELLPWENLNYIAIEPGGYNYAQLEKNLQENFSPERYQLHRGLVGSQSGDADFFESKQQPYSSSLLDRREIRSQAHRLPYVDLSACFAQKPCFVKMDIEGGEFLALETYRDYWPGIEGIVIEWHAEMGNVAEAEAVLFESGLKKVKRSWDNGNRLVDLYLRDEIASELLPANK